MHLVYLNILILFNPFPHLFNIIIIHSLLHHPHSHYYLPPPLYILDTLIYIPLLSYYLPLTLITFNLYSIHSSFLPKKMTSLILMISQSHLSIPSKMLSLPNSISQHPIIIIPLLYSIHSHHHQHLMSLFSLMVNILTYHHFNSHLISSHLLSLYLLINSLLSHSHSHLSIPTLISRLIAIKKILIINLLTIIILEIMDSINIAQMSSNSNNLATNSIYLYAT